MNQLKRQESKNIVIVGGGSSLGYELIQDLKSSSNKFIIVTSREELPFDQKNITIITSTLKNSKEVSRVCALIKEIFLGANNLIIKYLYFFTFTYFNLSFTRLAEYGTDKTGQLLIVILIIKLFDLICFNTKSKKLENIILLVPLLGFCITLKT